MVGDQAEQRRHQAGSRVGGGHLYADDGLGFVCSEQEGRGVDDAGINRRAAESDDDQARQSKEISEGQQ